MHYHNMEVYVHFICVKVHFASAVTVTSRVVLATYIHPMTSHEYH